MQRLLHYPPPFFPLFFLFTLSLSFPFTAASFSSSSSNFHTDPLSILICILLIILGLAYAFTGYRLFRPTLFITGFFIFGNIAIMALTAGRHALPSDHTTARFIILGVALGAGVLGGLLAVCCYSLGVFLIGALGGLILYQTIVNIAGIGTPWVQAILAIVCVILGMVLIKFFERPVIIIVTAIAGGFIAVAGIDVVINMGLVHTAMERLRGNGGHIEEAMWYELAAAVVVAVLGMLVQFRKFGDRKFGKQ